MECLYRVIRAVGDETFWKVIAEYSNCRWVAPCLWLSLWWRSCQSSPIQVAHQTCFLWLHSMCPPSCAHCLSWRGGGWTMRHGLWSNCVACLKSCSSDGFVSERNHPRTQPTVGCLYNCVPDFVLAHMTTLLTPSHVSLSTPPTTNLNYWFLEHDGIPSMLYTLSYSANSWPFIRKE